MSKQKMVIKMSLADAKKRRKALKTAVTVDGVVSVALDGDKLVIVGDGTDSVILTALLRKKMGYADLISVAEVKKEEKKDEKKDDENKILHPFFYPYQYTNSYPYAYLGGIYDHHKF